MKSLEKFINAVKINFEEGKFTEDKKKEIYKNIYKYISSSKRDSYIDELLKHFMKHGQPYFSINHENEEVGVYNNENSLMFKCEKSLYNKKMYDFRFTILGFTF